MRRRYVPPALRSTQTAATSISTLSPTKDSNIARRRLGRDFVELQRANISSISAHPLDNDIFEWHVNIKPTDGVYSGVYFHLIMLFPHSYPSKPPTVKICTPIKHPNIFDSFLCLSMLRDYTGNVPYEGWSGAYSVTSILMQLQSFLFAEKIDQDGGYQANARLSANDVKYSIQICKTFQCKKCKHTHSTPWPKVKGPPDAKIIVHPTDPTARHVVVQGSSCQTAYTYWVGAKGEFGCNNGKIMYEALINWTGDKWQRNNTRGGLCRFGFGTKSAMICGCSTESFGYGGTGMFSYDNEYDKFGESFNKDDTITVAVDFDSERIYFGKNGRLMEPECELYIPEKLRGAMLYPLLAFKNSRVEFNFGAPKRPCKWLIQNGFKSLEQIAMGMDVGYDDMDDDVKYVDNNDVDWHSDYIIPELWVDIFEQLLFEETFRAQFVCKKWHQLISKYNIMERNEIYCYFTKAKLGQKKGGRILGIGLSIRSSNNASFGIAIHSQMDILSFTAWSNGCRTGVWGEELTHFLPLVMNKKHAEIADLYIKQYLEALTELFCTTHKSNANELERCINKTYCLKLVDTLVTMMNLIVVQFVMGHENDDHTVSMVMCEKVVLGYCALHHLLLYLVSQNKSIITNFANKAVSLFINNGSHKKITRDLGKFLIYLMISNFDWNDVAQQFVEETVTRNVFFMLQEIRYSKYDTTNVVDGRLEDTLIASKISCRLVMFQVWFMKNNASETLHGYNQRLGRPTSKVRNAIFNKTKYILNCKSWWDYFEEIDVIIKDNNSIDQLLRFAIYNSDKNGYHRPGISLPVQLVEPPRIKVKGKQIGSGDERGFSRVDDQELNNLPILRWDDTSTINQEQQMYSWRNNRYKQYDGYSRCDDMSVFGGRGTGDRDPWPSVQQQISPNQHQQETRNQYQQQQSVEYTVSREDQWPQQYMWEEPTPQTQPEHSGMSKSRRRKLRRKKGNENQPAQQPRNKIWVSPVRPKPKSKPKPKPKSRMVNNSNSNNNYINSTRQSQRTFMHRNNYNNNNNNQRRTQQSNGTSQSWMSSIRPQSQYQRNNSGN